jgi:N-acetylglutamate synthase-like GNAT family acetyltransferase
VSVFSLRAATREDRNAIRELVLNGRINPSGLDWRRFVVAVSESGEIIGCGQIKPHVDGCRELASIAVAPTWRGKGVARAIIERLLAQSDDQMPNTHLYLMCRSGLRPLYEKFGFRPIQEAEMPPYFKRVSRLATLLDVVRKDGEKLLVMKRAGGG